MTSLLVARRRPDSGQAVPTLGSMVLGMLLTSPISWTPRWVRALVPAAALWRATAGGRVLAAALLVLRVTALVRLPQRLGAAHLGWSAWEQVVGNGCTLWALGALVWCAQRGRRHAPVEAMLGTCPAI